MKQERETCTVQKKIEHDKTGQNWIEIDKTLLNGKEPNRTGERRINSIEQNRIESNRIELYRTGQNRK